MSNSSGGDTTWLQIVIGIMVAFLTAGWGWVQLQISWLRKDGDQREERALDAIKTLRDEFNQRQDDHIATQNRQHDDNRAEAAATRALIQAGGAVATAEMRRTDDRLEKIITRLGEMPDRKEVNALLAVARGYSSPGP